MCCVWPSSHILIFLLLYVHSCQTWLQWVWAPETLAAGSWWMRCFIILYCFQNHRDNSANVAISMQFEKTRVGHAVWTLGGQCNFPPQKRDLNSFDAMLFLFSFILPVSVSKKKMFTLFLFSFLQSYLKMKAGSRRNRHLCCVVLCVCVRVCVYSNIDIKQSALTKQYVVMCKSI